MLHVAREYRSSYCHQLRSSRSYRSDLLGKPAQLRPRRARFDLIEMPGTICCSISEAPGCAESHDKEAGANNKSPVKDGAFVSSCLPESADRKVTLTSHAQILPRDRSSLLPYRSLPAESPARLLGHRCAWPNIRPASAARENAWK